MEKYFEHQIGKMNLKMYTRFYIHISHWFPVCLFNFRTLDRDSKTLPKVFKSLGECCFEFASSLVVVKILYIA